MKTSFQIQSFLMNSMLRACFAQTGSEADKEVAEDPSAKRMQLNSVPDSDFKVSRLECFVSHLKLSSLTEAFVGF